LIPEWRLSKYQSETRGGRVRRNTLPTKAAMNDLNIKPLPFLPALFYFGIPSAVAAVIVYALMPWLHARGFPFFFNYLLVYATAPMLALIVASLIAYQREGRALNWNDFSQRLRLGRMTGRVWLWAIGLAVFMVLSAGVLSLTSRWVAANVFSPPEFWPAEMRPSASAAPALPTEFMGLPLAGNGWIFVALFVSLVIATFGEEFWWRGYILPRQELAHGRHTWIVHGLLWAAFHLFAPWNFIAILPGCLALSYVAQRLKNTWPAVIAHGLANGLLVLLVVGMGILRG
jgi:membrane protease YdiL (CAAX protease family)